MMIKENLRLGMKSTIQFFVFPGKSSLVSLIVWGMLKYMKEFYSVERFDHFPGPK